MKNVAMLPGLLCCGVLVGQAPAWTLDEATIATVLPLLAGGEVVPFAGKPGARPTTIAGYIWRRTETPAEAGPGAVFYAWPREAGTRTFAITDRGVLMFTEQRTRAYGEDQCVPAWNAIVAKGSEARLDQALDMPGRGTDDQIWQPLAMVKATTSRIAVRGTDGAPVADVSVVVGAPSWFDGVPNQPLGDQPCPVGTAATDAQGQAKLTGIAVNGAHVALAIGQTFLTVPLQCEHRTEGTVVVVDGAEVARIRDASLRANESAAIATLKNMSSAQAQMRASAKNDANANGAGEYAFFAQLTGTADVACPAAPGGETRISPPVLSTAFANVQRSCVQRSGYVFQIFLPGQQGWVAEAKTGGAGGCAVDAKRAESLWFAYAWPAAAGQTGRRVFYVGFNHDVYGADGQGKYSGRAKRPDAEAAHVGHEAVPTPANDTVGNDGLHWRAIR